MRKATMIAAALAAALYLGQGPAHANHTSVTLSAPQVLGFRRSRLVTGNVTVRNTIASAQTGRLTVILFQVTPTGAVSEVNRKDLGTVNLDGNASTTITYFLGVNTTGNFIVLVDFASAIVGGAVVPHTHCGTFNLTID